VRRVSFTPPNNRWRGRSVMLGSLAADARRQCAPAAPIGRFCAALNFTAKSARYLPSQPPYGCKRSTIVLGKVGLNYCRASPVLDMPAQLLLYRNC
jgi:hypothetical protein